MSHFWVPLASASSTASDSPEKQKISFNIFPITAAELEEAAVEKRDSYLEFIEVVGVFPKLNHSTKDQYSSTFTNKAMGCTARRDVTPNRR